MDTDTKIMKLSSIRSNASVRYTKQCDYSAIDGVLNNILKVYDWWGVSVYPFFQFSVNNSKTTTSSKYFYILNYLV